MMGLEDVPKLQSIGVQSFKIEGRLKTPEYVAATAKHYRAILDGEDLNIIQRSNELALTYSRGFYSGWLHGVNHQELVDGTFSSHRGIFLGEIQHVKKNIILLKTSFDLRAGMGLFFAGDKDKGSKIFTVNKIPHGYEVELLTKDLDLKKGLKVYANSDEQLDKTLQKSWNLKEEKKKIPVTLIVEGEMHQKMKVTMIDVSGNKVEAESSSLLEKASQYALTKNFVLHELSSLGASIYKVNQEKYNLADDLFIHNKELKNIKRDLIEKMNLKRVSSRNSYTIKQPPSPPTYKHLGKTQLNILLRTKEQVEGLIKAKKNNFFQLCEEKIGVIILDFEFGRDYAVSLAQLKDAGLITALATTRVLKPLEYNNLKLLHHLQPDYILVRNLGALQFLKSYSTIPLIGDFSFNITNAYAHHYLLAKGLQSICCSYDLNQEQLLDLIQSSDPSTIEVNIHQYMPEFHMEHCVFAAFLSQGTSFRDCGKPCEKHDVELKDPYGEWHHLKADHECRNTFYKATPQSASFLVPKLQDLHIAALRIEALKEVSADFNAKIKTYLELLSRRITTDEALDILKAHESYGLGLGLS